jgi:hypothetical protein
MLTAFAILLDLAGSVTLSDRTEIRARAPGMYGPAAVDAETVITGGLTLRSRRFRFALGYSPHLAIWDAGTAAAQSTVTHSGQAHAEWTGRYARLSLDEVGSYGRTNLAAASPSPAPEGQPPRADLVPSSQVLGFASSTTTLAAGLTLHRWTVAARAGYQISGGADADDQRTLPLLTGPFGGASADYALSLADHALATLTASETTASSGPEALLVDATLGHRRSWSPITETWLTAGVSGVRMTVAPFASPSLAIYPVAEVGLARRAIASSRVSARASARLAPSVSQLTGLVDEWAQVMIGASYQRERLTAGAFLSASRSVSASTPSAGSLVNGELGAGYGAAKLVGLDAGVRGFWQRQEATGAALSVATLFVGVTLRAPPARL